MQTNVVSAENDGALRSNPVNGLSIFSNENTLKMWLDGIGMTQYLQLFLDEGFGDDLAQSDALSKLTNDDLSRMGIKKLAHRNVILSNVDKLGNVQKKKGARANEGVLGNNNVTIDEFDDSDDEDMDEFEFKRITSGNKQQIKKQSTDNESMYHRQMSSIAKEATTTATTSDKSGAIGNDV